jgi:hypothetical protein
VVQITAQILMSPDSKNKLSVQQRLPSHPRTEMALQETHDLFSY